MYGATHVIAVDGFSRKVVRCITIPIKNPIAIYDLLFRPVLVEEGIWDQVRVDHGTPNFSHTKPFGKLENKAGPSSLHADNVN